MNNEYPMEQYIIQYYQMGLYSLNQLKSFVDGGMLDSQEYTKITNENN